MSSTPLNTAPYQAIPVPPEPQQQPSSLHSHILRTPTKYGLTIIASVALTLLALFAFSSFSHSAPAHLAIPRTNARTQLLPDKPPTNLVSGSLYSVEWTGINGSADEWYQARSTCGPGTYVSKCLCNPIAMNARDVCASVFYAAPYADIFTRNEGCACNFQGESSCQNAAFTMYVDCQPI